ncbi:hypothetical protein HYU09_00480 [Candidatus Woesearchaeota archaeon]|nr:hypothetical protein [Candidatus Woesearchaeota archaeon]
MLSEKEKLEEELRFLKESYDIGVITSDEYENGKQRIQVKIKFIEEKENEGSNLFKEDLQKTDEEKIAVYDAEEKEEQQEKSASAPSYIIEKINKEIRAKPAFLKKKKEIKQEEDDEEIAKEIDEIIGGKSLEAKEQEEKEEEPEEGIFPLDSEDKKEIRQKKEKQKIQKYPEYSEDEVKFSKKTLVFAAVLIIAALGILYFFFTGNSDNADISNDASVIASNAGTLIACHSDNDCTEKRKVGICLNPGKENAECSFIDDIEVKLSVINTKECFNCDTQRVISILEGFYPNLDIEEIDYDGAEGKALADRFDINALPAYILNSSLPEAHNYEKFSSAFNKLNDDFVMKGTVSNANYYISREEVPNRLDLFVQSSQDASNKAEANLGEFLDTFDGEVSFNRHNSNSALAKELGLNSFPAFLINNKNKFSGVQAADTIKENFCQLNKPEECSLELSKNLV